jgi:CubicO group peptidase (beta-lactamase class C family)
MPGAFDEVDRLVEGGISRGIYPGAVIVIGRRDTVVYARGYGHLTWQTASPVPDPGTTLWDLASLTKVVATTPATMRLVEQGRVDLDRPLNAYLPRFVGGRKNEVTVRMLLDHTSGLPSYREFFRLAPTRDSAITLLYGTPLRRAPGQSPEYSDLNFLLLGLLVEQLSHQSLNQFTQREIFAPLAMENTLFLPPKSLADRTAPSGSWHGHPIGGSVNDQNAARFGGIAGHAGLFSTGLDLARYARFWLGGGAGERQHVLEPETMQHFLEAQARAGNRLLGWESPDPPGKEPVAAGTLLSPRAYGHTGWTGTEIWLDPARDFFLVFLTNRSYGPRVGHSIRELRAVRAMVADAAVRAVPGACRPDVSPPC